MRSFATSSARTAVCKFGGTSMATKESLGHVRDILLAAGCSTTVPKRIGVVVSAPGKRHKQDVKTTDLLIRLHKMHTSAEASTKDKETLVEEIGLRFSGMLSSLTSGADGAGSSSHSDSLVNQLVKQLLESEKEKLQNYDFVVSRGEYFAGQVISMALPDCKFVDPEDAVFLKNGPSGTAVVDFEYTMDALKDATNYASSSSSVRSPGPFVVLPGFFGQDRVTKAVRALPRGGSDISGALLGCAMASDVYENWTDVAGVFTADPNKVCSAKKIDTLSHAELFTLASNGAQVLQPDTVRIGPSGLPFPIHLRNTFQPLEQGTWINPGDGMAGKPRILGLVVQPDAIVLAGYPSVEGSTLTSAAQEKVEALLKETLGGSSSLQVKKGSDPWFRITGVNEANSKDTADQIHKAIGCTGMFEQI